MDSLFKETTPSEFMAAARQRLHIYESDEDAMLVIAGAPDFCTMPKELGGGRANVLDVAILNECIGGKHPGEVAVVFLEWGVEVVACAQCNQVFWIRRSA